MADGLHELTFSRETDEDAVFVCGVCAREIGFNKAQTSEPCATSTDPGWAHPDNPEQWMGSCLS